MSMIRLFITFDFLKLQRKKDEHFLPNSDISTTYVDFLPVCTLCGIIFSHTFVVLLVVVQIDIMMIKTKQQQQRQRQQQQQYYY
jgi:uncharacterized protein (DUF2062 family)